MEIEYIGYKEASKLTGFPLGTLYSLVSQKKIPHFRLGKRLVRFSKKEIENWLLSYRVTVE